MPRATSPQGYKDRKGRPPDASISDSPTRKQKRMQMDYRIALVSRLYFSDRRMTYKDVIAALATMDPPVIASPATVKHDLAEVKARLRQESLSAIKFRRGRQSMLIMRAINALLPAVDLGDTHAVDSMGKQLQREAALFGLDAPTQVQFVNALKNVIPQVVAAINAVVPEPERRAAIKVALIKAAVGDVDADDPEAAA